MKKSPVVDYPPLPKPGPFLPAPPSPSHGCRSSRRTSRSILGQWCEVTGWHGIVDVYLAKSICSKLAWILVILVSVCLTVNQCMSLILDFTSDNQWTTNLNLEPPPTNELGIDWPNMTVSNHETYLRSLLDRLQVNGDPFRVSNLKLPSVDSLEFFDQYQLDESVGNRSYFQHLLKDLEEAAQNGMRQLQNFTLSGIVTEQCNRTVIHCGSTSDFDLTQGNVTCCDQSTAMRNTFSIHTSAAVGQSYDTSRASSIYFLFDPRVNDYYEYIYKNEVPTAGLTLQLFYGQPDAAEISEIELAPGTHTLIGVTRGRFKTIQRVSHMIDFERPRKKPCRENADYAHFDYGKYSRPLCQQDCIVGASVNMCECSVSASRSIKMSMNTSVCMGRKLVTCGEAWNDLKKDLRTNANTSDTRSFIDCMTKCEEGCDYDTIGTRVSTSKFPATVKVPKFTRYLNRALGYRGLNFTDEDTRQLMFLEMFYESRQIHVIERSTRTTLDELVSNIGGAMGVWTGLSILSLYEMAVYFIKGLLCAR